MLIYVALIMDTIFVAALSEAVVDILLVAGMSGARSHGLFIYFGT